MVSCRPAAASLSPLKDTGEVRNVGVLFPDTYTAIPIPGDHTGQMSSPIAMPRYGVAYWFRLLVSPSLDETDGSDASLSFRDGVGRSGG